MFTQLGRAIRLVPASGVCALDNEDEPLGSGTAAPLIVTAELPTVLQARAEGLRRAHYPPERNHLSAHVTLFHALPPFAESEARSVLAALAAETPPPEALLAAVMDLGTGTALRIDSAAMLAVRDFIADRFHGLLTRQDQHAPRLHVTVQNKVLRAEARALQSALALQFRPEPFAFAGLALHRYLGGPWEPVGRWTFRGRIRR
jgi:hypothetical protein